MPTSLRPTGDLISFQGRRVLVTGAAAGIGAAIAFRFAEAGADLILLDVDSEGLAKVAAKAEELGSSVRVSRVDLARRQEIETLWVQLEVTELPHVLINNAGIYPMKSFLEVDAEFWRRVMAVNLEAALWMSQAFIGRRQHEGGVIVNLSSIEAILPFKDQMIPYGVSKAGLLALTRGLARDYGRQGFRVNAVIPGAVRTPGTEALMKETLLRFKLDLMKAGQEFQKRLALNRWGQPDEVARVVLFLASDLASYVQGAMVPVDGGFLTS